MNTPTPNPVSNSEAASLNVFHLGKPVRVKGSTGEATQWHYRLKAFSYDDGDGGVRALIESVVPSPRPGVEKTFKLEQIELA